ncbi:MAG TPA: polysaccharide deacetylase family protein [Bryobacteraceae bacterium]|nr:polysaccharide deacetylase family protein [Bryobacteraceae bacterium]
MTRRDLLALAAAPALAAPKTALVSITFDCEMSAHYPTWEQTEWNYRKGDLDDASKAYAVAVARRVAAAGGRMHFFVVGRVFEHPEVKWLQEIHQLGHAIGNHTYDHVNVTATEIVQLQHRFQRAPWLVAGKSPAQLIDDNIRLCTLAMKERLGIAPNGFRTPGGFPNGLADRPDLQNLLLSHGYKWISSKYPRHTLKPGTAAPQSGEIEAIVEQQEAAQPFRYPSGMLEIPMSPPSDVVTMRTGRWPRADFRRAVKASLAWCIERGKVWDFLSHPSAIGVADPKFEIIDMIIDTVRQAGPRARLVALDTVAEAFENSPA